jgi:hypothetical protein
MVPSAQSVRRTLSKGRRQRRCHASMYTTLTALYRGSGFIIHAPFVGTNCQVAMEVMAIEAKEQEIMMDLAEKDRQ